jgi:ketosteroid isomerase-like protein
MLMSQSQVKVLLDNQAAAMRSKDIDRLMSFYSPDVVYFDVVPPLQFVGSAALRNRFLNWFDGFEGPMRMDVRDVRIVESGDVAIAYWFSRASGTLKNGREVGSWVRVTSFCRRSHDRWFVTHEHVSVPVNIASGTAAMDLVP